MSYRRFCILAAVLIISSPLFAIKATAQPSLNVVAAFVGPHPNGKECKSNLNEQTIDFLLPNNLKWDCGVTFILNKKTEGTAYLQLRSNNIWVDVSTIDTFGWHPSIKKEYIKKFPGRKMNNQVSYNQGVIKNEKINWVTKDSNLRNNGNASFNPIYVWDNLTNFRYTEVGVNCHRTDITSFELRVKIAANGQEYFSNTIVQNYINADKYVTSTGYNFECVVTDGASSSASRTTSKTNSSLPLCTGSQEASLINLLSQYNSLSRMIGTYRNQLDKVNNNLGDAYARNALLDYEKLLIDKKSIESELNSLYIQGEKLAQSEKMILATCVRQDSQNQNAVPNNNNKLLPCTGDEINRLLKMIANYSTKQQLIRVTKSNIEKARVDLNNAISTGKNAGNFQSLIQKYNRSLESDMSTAESIKREFNALNSGCSNSKLSLP